MTAKFDPTVGIELFKETFDRDPRPMEVLQIAALQRSVLSVASFADVEGYAELWKRLVQDKIDADWAKYADVMMHPCMDGQP